MTEVLGVEIPSATKWFKPQPQARTAVYIDPKDTEWVDEWGRPSYVGLNFRPKTIESQTVRCSLRVGSEPVPVSQFADGLGESLAQMAGLLRRERMVLPTGKEPLLQLDGSARYGETLVHLSAEVWPAVPGLTVPDARGELGMVRMR